MYFNDICASYNTIWIYASLLIDDIEYYERDKKPLDVAFCHYDSNIHDFQLIKIEDVKVEKDKEGRDVVALIADTNYAYRVTPIEIISETFRKPKKEL